MYGKNPWARMKWASLLSLLCPNFGTLSFHLPIGSLLCPEEVRNLKKHGRPRHDPRLGGARSLKRWIFPVTVFGSSRQNRTSRGTLYDASRAPACSQISAAIFSEPWIF